jgi:membrane peptidoglycan carboxypeptidase
VLDFAKQAGIRYIWNDNGQRTDLTQGLPSMSSEVGIGQYPVTVLDHANGVATIAANGYRATEHFVARVEQNGNLVYGESFKPARIDGYSAQMAEAETGALEKVLQNGTGKQRQLTGRQAAAKTGTWEALNSKSSNDNSNAWMVGYIAPNVSSKPPFYGLATAVWMGATKGDSVAVSIGGQPMFGSTGPGKIWQGYMNVATSGMPKTKFPPAPEVGNDTLGNASPPAASPSNGQCDPTTFPFCINGNGGGNGNGGNGNNGNGNGNNGNGNNGNGNGGNNGGGNNGGGGNGGGGQFPGGDPSLPPTRQ